jgi:two-component system sensor histidine kinase QseC
MSWRDLAPKSLKARLALGVVAGVLLVLSSSFVVLHLVIRDELYRHLDEDMATQMRAVAEYAAANPGREGVTEYMPQFRTRAHQDFFQVWDGNGRTLARSDSSAGRDLPRLAATVGLPTYYDLALPDGHLGRAVSQSFKLPAGDPRGFLTVVVAEETENLDRLESRIHYLLLAIAGAAALAMLLITRFAVLRGLQPVGRFARSLESVNPEDPKARLETGPLPSELRPVAASFSRLLDRLLDALAREKRYARNVAHELRNPLAEMRLLADVGSTSRDTDACHAAIRDIGAAAAEMEQTVESLMALTRYESGLESPQPEPVDLCAELRGQTRELTVAAEKRALTLALDVPGEVWVYTDSALVHRLFANLLGNAVAHSPRGSTVHVAVDPEGIVTVANPAPHLRAVDVPRLGERFYQIGSGDRGSHAGLGLSLAQAIAKVLGLSLRLALRDDGCLVVSMRGFRPLARSVAEAADGSRPG